MGEFKYQVSFLAFKTCSKTMKPKWWQFYKRPVFIEYSDWIPYSIYITESEWSELFKRQTECKLMWRVLFRALANVDEGNVSHLQIETINSATPYVKTSNNND